MMQRRRLLAAAAAMAVSSGKVHAGAQVEEPLADSVRSALSAAIASAAPPRPSFGDIEARLTFLRWQGAMGERLKRYKSDRHTRLEFLATLWYESKRSGLEPALVLAVIEVLSDFKKYKVSPDGARGYMQVTPAWASLIGDGDAAKLFHTQVNLRFGTVILRHYLEKESGDTFLALGSYVGWRGDADFPDAVMRARQHWQH